MANNYWEHETPVVVDTGKNVLRYFDQAGKLQVSMPYWTNDAGEQRPGKTVTMDVAALLMSPDALEVVRKIIGAGGA